MSILSKTRANNDLGHPLFENIRNGDWMLHYIADRLKPFSGTRDVSQFFFAFFSRIITGRNEVVAKVIFLHLSVILLTGRGVCLSACWNTTPPEQTPPRADTPQEQTPPRADTAPGSRHPPWE